MPIRSPFVFCHNKRDPNDPAHRDHWRWPDGAGGGGLFGRWFALENFPVRAELVAVCDLREELLEWFAQVPTVQLRTQDHRALLARDDVDAVYVAVPHHLHEALYCDVLAAGKDLLAEKPLASTSPPPGVFVRPLKPAGGLCDAVRNSLCPGAQRAFQYVQSGALGRVLEVRAGFLHSSDLDPTKAANWKRQSTPAVRSA